MHELTNKAKRAVQQDQNLESLEAEYQRNQQRMRRIDRRNRQLAEQIRLLQEQPEHFPPKVAPFSFAERLVEKRSHREISRAHRPKSLLRRFKELRQGLQGFRWGKYSLEFWLQVAVLALGIALVCGTLSFMVTRLIATLLGG